MLVNCSFNRKVLASLRLLPVILVTSALPAHACELVVEEPPLDIAIDYDVFDFFYASGTTTIRLKNQGSTDCEGEVSVTDDGMMDAPFQFEDAGLQIELQLPEARQETSVNNRGGAGYIIDLPPSESRDITLDFFTEQDTVVAAGTHTKRMRVSVANSPGGSFFEELEFSVSITAQPRVQLNISGSDGNFGNNTYSDTVQFNDPKVGDKRLVYVQSRSNAMHTMSISSKNGGRMMNTQGIESWIAYELALDGKQLDISSPVSIPNREMTDMSGESQPLDIEIKELHNVFSGGYEDEVYISLTAQ